MCCHRRSQDMAIIRVRQVYGRNKPFEVSYARVFESAFYTLTLLRGINFAICDFRDCPLHLIKDHRTPTRAKQLCLCKTQQQISLEHTSQNTCIQ